MKKLLLVVGLAAVGYGGYAGAAPSADLTWQRGSGAERCISADDLRSLVELRLRRRVFTTPEASSVRVAGSVTRSASQGWDVRLTISPRDGSPGGRRELHADAEDCRDLDAQLGLIVALLLDAEPEMPLLLPPPRRASEPVVVPPASAERSDARASRPTSKDIEIQVAGVVGWGMLPATAVGIEGALRVGRADSWGGRLAATYFRPESLDLPRGTSAYPSFVAADASICPMLTAVGLVRSHACGGVEVGLLEVSGTGFTGGHTGRRVVVAPQLSTDLTIRLSDPWTFVLSATGRAPLMRDRFSYDDPPGSFQTFFRVAPVSLTLGAGISALFH